jgi:hypothetical protein
MIFLKYFFDSIRIYQNDSIIFVQQTARHMETYRGFIIEKEISEWSVKVGDKYCYYPEGDSGPSDCSVHGFSTIEEAKEDIDEKYNTGKYL